jgi:hypothetical protein
MFFLCCGLADRGVGLGYGASKPHTWYILAAFLGMRGGWGLPFFGGWVRSVGVLGLGDGVVTIASTSDVAELGRRQLD